MIFNLSEVPEEGYKMKMILIKKALSDFKPFVKVDECILFRGKIQIILRAIRLIPAPPLTACGRPVLVSLRSVPCIVGTGDHFTKNFCVILF